MKQLLNKTIWKKIKVWHVLLGLFLVGAAQGPKNSSNDGATLKYLGKKYLSSKDDRDWIKINADSSFTISEYIPNSEERFVFNGKIDGRRLKHNGPMEYKGRNNYRESTFLPEIDFYEGGGLNGRPKTLNVSLKNKGFRTVDFKKNRREWVTETITYRFELE